MACLYLPLPPFLLIVSFAIFAPQLSSAAPPAIFIFGDSTSDVGTNSFILGNQAQANFPHYGVDFVSSRATGRFSNGFNTVDFLSKLMGFKRSPEPFLFLNNLKNGLRRKKFRGVNFASGGSGLLNITSQTLNIIHMPDQINQFITVRSNLTSRIGQSSTDYLISKSIFLMSSGSNDIIENFVNNHTRLAKEQFIPALMTAYESYIKILYGLGARKFGFISVLPMGCCPSQRIFNTTGGCSEVQNDIALSFYTALDALLYKISSELQEFKYSLGNTYAMVMNVIRNPARYNFKVVDRACCGSWRLNEEIIHCNSRANMCEKRSEYAFWDGSHPTHAASHLAAQALYSGHLGLVSPINFGQLVADN